MYWRNVALTLPWLICLSRVVVSTTAPPVVDGLVGRTSPMSWPTRPDIDCPPGCECYSDSIQCRRLTEFPTNADPHSFKPTFMELQGCEIPELGPGQLEGFPDLQYVWITFTDVTLVRHRVFSNLSKLVELKLDHSRLSNVSKVICSLQSRYGVEVSLVDVVAGGDQFDPATFSCLGDSGVKSLNLSSNALGWTEIEQVFCNRPPTLHAVYLRNIFISDMVAIPPGVFHCLRNSHVRIVDFSNNLFENFRSDTFLFLDDVEELYLYHVTRSYTIDIAIFTHMTRLKLLDLRSNELRAMPKLTSPHSDKQGILPRLERLLLGENRFVQLEAFAANVVNQLQVLSIAGNREEIEALPDYFISEIPTLKVLELSGSRFQYFERYAFMSDSLETLDLSHVELSFLYQPEHRVLDQAYSYASNLRTLLLDGFALSMAPPEVMFDMGDTDWERSFRRGFQNLSRLEVLRMDGIGLNIIYGDNFLNTNNLTRLELNNNRISVIHVGAFDDFRQINRIDLNYNEIARVNKSLFKPQLFDTLRNVGLRGNPFACDCSMYWFRQFVNNPPCILDEMADKRMYRYKCSSPSDYVGKDFLSFNPTWNDCFFTSLQRSFFIVIAVKVTILLAFLMSSIIFRLRWDIHYWYISLRARRRHYAEFQDDDYRYDAFVAYAYSDTCWVTSVLWPVLENEHKVRLCLHDRDWGVGRGIADNIFHSIEESRKVLLVISNAFAASEWCRLELTMAQHKLFSEDRDNLILLVREDILDCYMTPQLALQMKIKTFIRWTESEKGQQVFWERLVRAIKKPNQSVSVDKPQAMTEL